MKYIFVSGGGETANFDVRLKVGKCFCNRDFTVDELRNIVIQLRKKEKTGAKQILRDKNNTKNFPLGEPILDKDKHKQFVEQTEFDVVGEKIFYLNYPEKISPNEANFEIFTKLINEIFKKYEINTCIRKIHFLAQSYEETQEFGLTYEADNFYMKSYFGGPEFRGRGLLQLTHDYAYAKYYAYCFGDKGLDLNGGKIKDLESKNTDPKRLKVVGSSFYKNVLMPFTKKLSTEMKFACDSAGWNWKFDGVPYGGSGGNINILADKDDVVAITKAINGGTNGLEKRKLYTKLLKEIMQYESNHKK